MIDSPKTQEPETIVHMAIAGKIRPKQIVLAINRSWYILATLLQIVAHHVVNETTSQMSMFTTLEVRQVTILIVRLLELR